MKRQTLTIIISVLLSVNMFAGSFRTLNVREGLSSRQVFQINKDSAGFIWAYTHLGIDRYDGNEIRNYKLDTQTDSKDHILSSTVMSCDSQGRLWVALKNGKIYLYDSKTDSFKLYLDIAEFLPASVLYDILCDANNHLWISTSTGIYSWEDNGGLSLAGLKGQMVNCLIQQDAGTYFAGTDTYVYKLKLHQGARAFSEEILPFTTGTHIESLYIHGQNLYIGTFSEGAFAVNMVTGQMKSFSDFIPPMPVRTFSHTKDNSVLVGVDGAGVFRIDAATGKLVDHYTTDEDDDKSLNGNTVTDICVDGQDRIWISTSTNGISYLDPERPEVKWIRHEQNNPNSLHANHVNAILQDSEGDCWYGTNDGVSLYQPRLKKWTHFLNDKRNSSKVILTVCEDDKGNIWVGGFGTGLYCIHKKTGKVRRIGKRGGKGEKGVATDYIYAIYADGDNLWLGGIDGELTCYNTLTDTFIYYPVDCVGDIRPYKDGRSLLIAGCDGLAFFDKFTGETRWLRQFGDVTLRYPIRCLLQSSAGDIWLATDGDGLIRFNPDTNRTKVYTKNEGITSNSINSLIEDRNGRIWFNTEKELYCLDVANDIIINANDFFDINWGYYNPAAAFQWKDGTLAFGTAEGVLTFLPSLETKGEGDVKLLFTEFKLLYRSIKAGIDSPLQTNINETQKVGLTYTQNSFSISFSAINFSVPHRVRYEYILEGADKEWRSANYVQSVNYMNLSPGKYIFKLRAFDKYTGRQIGERNLEIVIRSPFWVSGWAILLYIAILFSFVYLFIQAKRHKANENKIKEKIDSFISIAHDIRTPLSLIKAPLSELEMQQDLSAENKSKIAVAAKNVDRLFAMMNQLLDLQKAEQLTGSLKVSLCNVYTYMEDKVSYFSMAAQQKGIEMQLHIASDMPEVMMDRDKMDHIMDNLLSNALRYTEKGVIRISVGKTRKKWFVSIQDTGIGIPQGEQRNIFNEYYRAKNAVNSQESGAGIGLMITRRLVQQHRGAISFRSTEGSGTVFVVTFPQKIKSNADIGSIPKVDERETTPDVSRSKQEIEENNKNTLLLVEDDKEMREYLTDSLSPEYKVISAPDGGKGLEIAKEINPDIIISDIVMPVLQGDELCRILKSSVDTSHIPVILLTALSERENIIVGLEAGATDYIIKPFDLSVLKVRLRNILQSRQQLRETVLSMDNAIEETDYTTQLDKEFLDKVKEVINAEMANSELSINDFCRLLGMSRTSVYNKIKTLTGQGPNDFIRIVRLNKAKELIMTRRYAIGEVSSMVGFSDPKYFSTCFKKQFGISPSKV